MSNGRFVAVAQFFDSEGRLVGESNFAEFGIPDELNSAYRTYIQTGWAAVAASASIEILQSDADSLGAIGKELAGKVAAASSRVLRD